MNAYPACRPERTMMAETILTTVINAGIGVAAGVAQYLIQVMGGAAPWRFPTFLMRGFIAAFLAYMGGAFVVALNHPEWQTVAAGLMAWLGHESFTAIGKRIIAKVMTP